MAVGEAAGNQRRIGQVTDADRQIKAFFQQIDAARTMTKVVAMLMPRALSMRFETPMNGHRPRNLTSTTLLTRAVAISRKK